MDDTRGSHGPVQHAGQDLWLFSYPDMQAMADGVLQALSTTTPADEVCVRACVRECGLL